MISTVLLGLALAAPPDFEALRPFIEARVAEQPGGGLVVGVSYEGRRWTRAFGWAVQGKRKMTVEDAVRWASITKLLTAVAVLQQVEDGKMALDAPVQRYLPEFPEKQWPVRIEHLLSHASGLPHYGHGAKQRHITRSMPTQEALALFSDLPLRFEPGTAYLYTSDGFNLLGAAAERVSRTPYEALLERRIFGPAGARTAFVERGRAKVPPARWPAGYRVVSGKLQPSESIHTASRFAGGGTRGTVDDLLAIGEALLDGRLLERKAELELRRPRFLADGSPIDYGFGTAAYARLGRWVSGHAGNQPETSALLLQYPSEGLTLALLCNVEGQSDLLYTVAGRLADVALSRGEPRRGLAGASFEDHVRAEALERLFSHGLARRRAFPDLPPSPEQIVAGKAWVQALLRDVERLEPPLLAERLERGAYASEGEPWRAVGWQLAEDRLVHEGARGRDERTRALDRFVEEGPVGFLRGWLAVGPEQDILREGLGRALASAADLALPRVKASTSTASLAAGLAPLASRGIRPDLSGELISAAEASLDQGREARARAFVDLLDAWYPASVNAALRSARLRCRWGDREGAKAAATRAARLPFERDRFGAARVRYRASQLGGKAGRCYLRAAALGMETDAALLKSWLKRARRDRAGPEIREARRALRR